MKRFWCITCNCVMDFFKQGEVWYCKSCKKVLGEE